MGYGPFFAPPSFPPAPPFFPPTFYSSSLSVSLSLVSSTSDSVTISWQFTGENIQNGTYIVDDLSISSGQFTSGSGISGTYTFSGLSPSTSYTVFISGLATDTQGTVKFASDTLSVSTTAPPPTVSISASRTTPTNVQLSYSVSAPSGGGTTTWSISGTGSPYTSAQSLSAGGSASETINITVTPRTTRYTYTISASNNGGSVSASSSAPATNPTAAPSGSIIVSETTSYNTLTISIGVNAPGPLVNGNAYYTVSGPGLSISGITPVLDSEAYDFVTDAVLSPGTSYTYTLTIYNNYSTVTYTGTATTKNVQPPTNLTASSITSTSAVVSWTASATSGATYVVSSTGGTVNYSSGTSASITGLSPNTSYTVSVTAQDSGYSSSTATVTFTTSILRTITATISATSSLDGTEATVSWEVTKSSGVTLTIVEVWGPGVDVGGVTSGSTTAVGLSPGGTYTWYVVALGFYQSEQLRDSDSVTLTMNQAIPGAPSAPVDFTATATNTGTVSLTWGGSTSAGGFPPVTYYLSGPGTISTPVTTNNYATVTGLSPNTTYTWSLYAQNANPSTPNTSATITASATTLSSSSGVATLVTNITATSSADGTTATVTWSTVNYGTAIYYAESETVGDGLSFYSPAFSGTEAVTGLVPGSTYTFRTFVYGFTRSGLLISASDSYTLTMSNPNPVTPPAPISDKVYYHNGTTWVQAAEVLVYNGSWVSTSIRTSDGKGNWT